MPKIATSVDLLAIARREALYAGKKLLGVTASAPRHVAVPDDSDPGAVFEWVVDVRLLDGPSQAIVSDDPGLRIVQNVLISHLAVGDTIADLNTPVEIEISRTGQLQVVGRAKVQLPDLQLDYYTLDDLQLAFLVYSRLRDDGIEVDAFGVPISQSGVRRRLSVAFNQRPATFGELGQSDAGATIGWGFQPLQRTIVERVTNIELEIEEQITVGEGATVS